MNTRLRSALVCLSALWLLPTYSARAGYDAFLQFGTGGNAPVTEGESQQQGFEKAVEILSFSFGISNPATIASSTSGAGAGKAQFSTFSVMKTVDAASPKLFQACATGQHYDQVKLSLRSTGANGTVFLTYTFKTVFVSSVQWSGSGGGGERPTESVSFAFGALSIQYTQQNPADGTLVPLPEVSWDVTANSAQ